MTELESQQAIRIATMELTLWLIRRHVVFAMNPDDGWSDRVMHMDKARKLIDYMLKKDQGPNECLASEQKVRVT